MKERRGGLGAGERTTSFRTSPPPLFFMACCRLIEGPAATVKGVGVGLGLEVKT